MGKNIQKMLDQEDKTDSRGDHIHKLEERMSRTEENQLDLWYVDYCAIPI